MKLNKATCDPGSAGAAESSEQRFAPRRRSKIPALLFIDGVMQGVQCHIADVSTTGARVELKKGWDDPIKHYATTAGRVRLVERIEKVAYDCKIVRREPTELGLKFLAPPILPDLVKR